MLDSLQKYHLTRMKPSLSQPSLKLRLLIRGLFMILEHMMLVETSVALSGSRNLVL